MFSYLEKLLNIGGGKCLIVENNEPRYVVMTVAEHEKIFPTNFQPVAPSDSHKPESALFSEALPPKTDQEPGIDIEKISLDDLPF